MTDCYWARPVSGTGGSPENDLDPDRSSRLVCLLAVACPYPDPKRSLSFEEERPRDVVGCSLGLDLGLGGGVAELLRCLAAKVLGVLKGVLALSLGGGEVVHKCVGDG